MEHEALAARQRAQDREAERWLDDTEQEAAARREAERRRMEKTAQIRMERDLAKADEEEARAAKHRAQSADERRRRLAQDAKRGELAGRKPSKDLQERESVADWNRLSKEADLDAAVAKEKRDAVRQRQELRIEAEMEEEERRRAGLHQPRREESPKRERWTTGEGKPILLPPPGLFMRNISTVGGRGSTRAKLMRYWFDHAPAFAC